MVPSVDIYCHNQYWLIADNIAPLFDPANVGFICTISDIW